MGYDIKIGNAKPHFDKDDGCLSAKWVVENKTLDEAPSFPNDELTGKSNARHPSYSAWAEFLREVGLYDLFLGDGEGLMKQHPGCSLITREHVDAVESALRTWKESHAIAPGFSGDRFENGKFVEFDVGKYDHQLARLMWLAFWMRWSVENCEAPAMENS